SYTGPLRAGCHFSAFGESRRVIANGRIESAEPAEAGERNRGGASAGTPAIMVGERCKLRRIVERSARAVRCELTNERDGSETEQRSDGCSGQYVAQEVHAEKNPRYADARGTENEPRQHFGIEAA